MKKKKTEWIAEALFDMKKNTVHIIEKQDNQALWYSVITQLYESRFKIVKVSIKIIK